MKTNIETTEKKSYSPPKLERIQLDNESSLTLASDDSPIGDPGFSKAPEYFNNDPFKNNVG